MDITVAIIDADGTLKIKTVPNELKTFQGLVGGRIETTRSAFQSCTYCSNNYLIDIVDEEWRIKYRPLNTVLPRYGGTVVICRTAGDEFASITDADAQTLAMVCTLIQRHETVRFAAETGALGFD